MTKTGSTRNGTGAGWAVTRSKILLAAGLLGVAHETLLRDADRPYLLLLFASMMGLASFLKLDDLLTSRRFRVSIDAAEDTNAGRNGP